METTMSLLNKALAQNPNASDWCRVLEVNRTAIAVAKTRGRLSPTLAGNLARVMGEPVEHWIAVAALEAEPESKAKHTLLKKAGSWSVRTSL
jgi:hypothetical protein